MKSLSKKASVPLGSKLDNLFGDYLVICRKVFEEKPEMFIVVISDLKAKGLIYEGIKNNIKSY